MTKWTSINDFRPSNWQWQGNCLEKEADGGKYSLHALGALKFFIPYTMYPKYNLDFINCCACYYAYGNIKVIYSLQYVHFSYVNILKSWQLQWDNVKGIYKI